MSAGSLIRRRPVTCEPTATIREAAETMAGQRVSSLLVESRDGLGIITDRDLRTRVLAEGLGPETPVAAVMTHPAVTVDAEMTVAEVLAQMLEREFHHLPVVDGGKVGVITDTDLMRLERYSPFALKSAIHRADDVESVVAVGRDLPRTVNALVEAHADPVDIGHVVGVTIDALTTRLIDLTLHEVGVPSVPWAWMALGSAARHEQALFTDQDHALAYEVQDEPAEQVDAAFADLAKRVTDALEAVGHPAMQRRRHGGDEGVPAVDGRTGSRRSGGWMSDPGITGSIFTSIVFDYRRVTGGLEIEATLDELIRAARDDRDFLRHLARRALDRRPPTGFRGNLVVEGKGEHAGTLDVKHGGITLITNIARVLGIASGLTERRTLKRLRGAAAAGRIDTELEEGLAGGVRRAVANPAGAPGRGAGSRAGRSTTSSIPARSARCRGGR